MNYITGESHGLDHSEIITRERGEVRGWRV